MEQHEINMENLKIFFKEYEEKSIIGCEIVQAIMEDMAKQPKIQRQFWSLNKQDRDNLINNCIEKNTQYLLKESNNKLEDKIKYMKASRYY